MPEDGGSDGGVCRMQVVNLKDYPRDKTKYIGRGSSLGNPFTHLPLAGTKALVQCDTVESAVGCFEAWLRGDVETWKVVIPLATWQRAQAALAALRGDELLGCYCARHELCHGHVIVKVWEEKYGGTK